MTTDEKENESKIDKEEPEEKPLPAKTFITLYHNPSLKGSDRLNNVQLVDCYFPDNQKMRLRIEAEDVKVYLEEVK